MVNYLLTHLIIFNNLKQYIPKNTINNNCDIKKHTFYLNQDNVKCFDHGKYKKYCDHPNFPKEFVVEKNIYYYNSLIVKPKAMYKIVNNNTRTMVRFYYNFHCDENSVPSLKVNVVPEHYYDLNPILEKITGFSVGLFILVYSAIIVICLLNFIVYLYNHNFSILILGLVIFAFCKFPNVSCNVSIYSK